MKLTFVAVLAVIGPLAILVSAAEPLSERWLYYPANLLVTENIDQLEAVWRRAAKVGYTHVNLGDTKFCILDQMPDRYFKNAEQVKALAKELKLELVPGVFPIGWSNALLANDPNLAEGLPVRDALFVVQDGEARLVADPPVSLPPISDLSQWNWHDETVQQDGSAARIADPGGQNARIMKTLQVKPFRQFHISEDQNRELPGQAGDENHRWRSRAQLQRPRHQANAGLDRASHRL